MNEAATGLLSPTTPVNFTDRQLRNFWAKVDKNGPLPDQSKPYYKGLGPCHVWTGHTRGGYGRIKIGGGLNLTAHRVAWELANGNIPQGLCVLHRCDNRKCVSADHLFLGTPADNNWDKSAKGRAVVPSGDNHPSRLRPEIRATGDRNGARKHPERIPKGIKNGRHTMPENTARGERQGSAKLTAEIVSEIRRRYSPRVTTMKHLSEEYGIYLSTVYKIIIRHTWKHVP